jgi:hypothetical protein
MKSKLPRIFLLLLGAIFLLNLLQSYFTPLIFDEAYYWHYAQNLAWGYFDHPPMVAFMIKLGSFFFDGELGVRLVSCILSTVMFFVIWATIDSPKKRDYVIHFFVLVFSMALLNAYGFFTLPDSPLLFFTALFLYVYKRFLHDPSLRWAIVMGVVIAALMYSKYHATLVILFVLLSNLKLVANKYAWLSVFVALLCYSPHFLWLYQNDFISIKYHLFNRPNAPYSFEKYTLGFWTDFPLDLLVAVQDHGIRHLYESLAVSRLRRTYLLFYFEFQPSYTDAMDYYYRHSVGHHYVSLYDGERDRKKMDFQDGGRKYPHYPLSSYRFGVRAFIAHLLRDPWQQRSGGTNQIGSRKHTPGF